MTSDWITHTQAAEVIGVRLTAVGKMVRRGELHPRHSWSLETSPVGRSGARSSRAEWGERVPTCPSRVSGFLEQVGVPVSSPLRVAVINDFPLVVRGVEHLLAPFSDRVEVCEWSAGQRGGNGVDIALFDAFAAMEVRRRIQQMVRAGVLVVVYSWTSAPAAVEQAMASGASGFVSKKMDATSLLSALEQVYAGQVVKMLSVPAVAETDAEAESWPGQAAGLNERESEVLALLTRGLRNKEIANAMFVGPDSVKAYIRRTYRKIGVDSRTKAVLWAMDNGFRGSSA